ncbi:transposase [Actinomadura miaoliensis]|uniref:transposase n=1 Tax=Actinomadura miaoliensis TaxID=430685 RepID=UPI003CD055A7
MRADHLVGCDGGRSTVRGLAGIGHAGQGRQLPGRGERARGHRAAPAALNGRLFIPAGWDDACADEPAAAEETQRKRARCGVPGTERSRPTWQMALEMLDEPAQWGAPPRPPGRRRSPSSPHFG